MRTNYIDRKFSLRASAALALATCLWIPAGSLALAQDTAPGAQQGARSDGDLQSQVASALAHDAALQGQQIKAYTSNGVVTLTGTVQNEQQRQEAETVAASVQGVSGIQNSLNVADGSDRAQTPPPPPAETQQAQPEQAPPPPDAQQSQAPAATQQMPPPPPPDQPAQPRTPYQPGYGQQPSGQYPAQQGYQNYPPPQQTSGPVTIPAGTLLQIRLSEPLDITRVQDGATFQATAASDVFEGNVLAIPRGAVLQGSVVHVKKPGALGGSGELQLQITSVDLGGRMYPVTTDLWSNKGPSKAGYTAGNTAGGAIAGAIIGGIIGRGPGAAIGALAGGGAGMAASAATNGPRLYLPAETLLNFHLANATTVQPVSWQEAQRLEQSAPRLQRRTVYMAPPYPYGYPYPYPYPYRVY
jgi:outer membrane biosynthesis protein TonB